MMIDRRMVMAVLWALSRVHKTEARPERVATRWAMGMPRLRRGM